MGALSARGGIHGGNDFYLCPLSAIVVPPERLEQLLSEAWSRPEPPNVVERQATDGKTQRIAEGYQCVETITAQVDGTCYSWTERRLLVRSLAQAHAAEQGLRTRLEQAQCALADLLVGRQGKPKLTERAAVEQAVTDLLKRYRVEGLLTVTVTEQLSEHPVRPYRDRPATVRRQRQFTISSRQEPLAIENTIRHLGWRVYATNQVGEDLSLAQAVLAYRDEYVVERDFGRLKGRPLSLSPMYVERDDHATGLVRLLSIALRILTLMEFVVRRQLAQEGAALAGLYAGNPKRATTHPTTERLLEAFQEITLTLVIEPHQTRRHLTALSALQQRVVALLEFTPTIYTKLCGDSSEPP